MFGLKEKAIAAVSLLAVGYAGGYHGGYVSQEKRVESYQQNLAKAEGAALLRQQQIANELVEEKEARIKLANDLEKSHEQAIETINYWYDRNESVSDRLRSAIKNDCRKTLPETRTPKLSEDTTGESELSERLGNFLKSEFKSCAVVSEYAQRCYEFVSDNCGLK